MSPSAIQRPASIIPVRRRYPPVAGFVGWWDAADSSTITVVSGKCSQWNDKGSAAVNLSQGTAANRPLTGSNTIGGLNVLSFNGSATDLTGTDPVTAAPHTDFIVAQSTASGAGQRDAYVMFSGAGGKDGRIYRTTGDAVAAYSGAGPITQGSWGAGKHCVSCVFNGASSKIAVDGAAATTGTTGASVPDASWHVGSLSGTSEFWLGYIGEIIIYASALSDANRQLVEAYLRAKWSI